jgi:5'-nucleotidase
MIILTNDDGIDAPGIQALFQAVVQAFPDRAEQIATVAPAAQQSGCGHQVTTFAPIGLKQRSAQAWAVDGTPADCTRVAIAHLHPQTAWVLSGINAGGNMGSDVYISGTVAAVREAALHRIPAIAFSHYRDGSRAYNWSQVSDWTATILQDLMQRPYAPGTYWNVNFPHLAPDAPTPEIVFCPSCTQPLPVQFEVQAEGLFYRAKYSDRRRDQGGDVATCLGGKIAITQLKVGG